MERIIGIDVGSVRIGIAISDPLGMTAQPLEVIQCKKVDPVERIKELVEEHDAARLVVGLPLQLNGEVGPAAQSAQAFAKKVEEACGKPVELWDERMSTAAAERDLIGGGVRRKKRKESIDKIAAALILQSYLDAKSAPSLL